MALKESTSSLSFIAAASMATAMGKFAAMTAENTVGVNVTNGALVVGVIDGNPDAAGKSVAVVISGRQPVVAGGTIAAGDAIASENDGTAIVAATADNIVGLAMTSAAAGEMVEVLLGFRGVSA
jgi:hypothetical protein